MDKLAVIGLGILCVLGIIAIPEYIELTGRIIVSSVVSYVFWVIIGGFAAVFCKRFN